MLDDASRIVDRNWEVQGTQREFSFQNSAGKNLWRDGITPPTSTIIFVFKET